MQLFSRNKALVALSLSALTVLGACGDDVTVTETPTPETVSLSPANLSLNVGEVGSLAAQITGGTNSTLATCTASSAVITVAVNSGACRVTAVSPGNATVTATTSTGKSASAGVTVNSPAPAIVGLSVTPAAANLTVGGTVAITANPTTQATGASITRSYVTSNSAVATVSTTGTVTAVAPGSATITVTLVGSGTGLTTATVTGQVAITVTALPTGITSITPSAVTVLPGQTGTIAPNVVQPSGAPAATVTYTSDNAAIATVSSTGVVTGVVPGATTVTVTATSAANASFSATTVTAKANVIVIQPATVSIASITQGPTVSGIAGGTTAANTGITFSNNTQVNQPVDLANVRDQIQVNVNFDPGTQQVSSVRGYVCDNAGANCILAVEQTFAAGAATAGVIALPINTADFTADFANSVGTVRYTNGQKQIRASVRVGTTETFAATNNNSVVNFNNIDGWAAQFAAPTATATYTDGSGNQWNYFGGPGSGGVGTARFAPVFYTPGRSVQNTTVGVSSCGSKTYAAAPYTTTVSANASSTTNINCSGFEHSRSTASNVPTVSAAQDNQNNPAPTVSSAANYRTSVAVPAVVAIRLDYNGPQTPTPSIQRALPAVTGWVNAGYNFNTNTGASTDNGVGMPSTQSRSWTYSGCSNTAAAFDGTSNPIAECSSDFTGGWNGSTTIGPYTVAYSEADQLGNSRTSGNSGNFGVDKTAPLIRFSNTTNGSAYTTITDTLVHTTAPTNLIQAEYIDERAGFINGSTQDVNAPKLGGGVVTVNDRSQYHGLAQLGGWAGTTKSRCLVGTAPSTGFTPITAPNCTAAITAVPLPGTQLVDGYRPGFDLTAAVLATLPTNPSPISGVYGYQTLVYDRAGNASSTLSRRFSIDLTRGQTTGLQIPATIASSGNAFLATYQDSVEIRSYTVALAYGYNTTDTLVYPQTLIDARYNDVANTPASTTLGFPMASIPTSVELTNGAGALVGTPVLGTDFGPVRNLGVRTWDLANRASGITPAFGADTMLYAAILSTSVPAHTNFTSVLTGNLSISSFTVLGSTVAGFNAVAGLKAQAAATTNSLNAPFDRVDFYRRQAAGQAGIYEYLGSVSAAASADAGATRYWTYVLPAASFAAQTGNLSAKQTATTAANDEYIAIGVRTAGGTVIGLRTPVQTAIAAGTLP